MDDKLGAALKSLPRERAGDGFTAGVLRRLEGPASRGPASRGPASRGPRGRGLGRLPQAVGPEQPPPDVLGTDPVALRPGQVEHQVEVVAAAEVDHRPRPGHLPAELPELDPQSLPLALQSQKPRRRLLALVEVPPLAPPESDGQHQDRGGRRQDRPAGGAAPGSATPGRAAPRLRCMSWIACSTSRSVTRMPC